MKKCSKFVINVDEDSPEFHRHVLERLEYAKKHPERSISIHELRDRLALNRKKLVNA